MARNGSGTYSLYTPGNPVVTGTTISSTWANNTLNDIATALTNSIAKDGQTTPTANLPMGTFKLTGLGAGSAATDSLNLTQAQNEAYQLIGTIAGTDTITGSLTPNLTSYVAGQTFRFVAANTNTGAVTINVNGLGAKSITKNGTNALSAGDLTANAAYQITYDGTQFQLSGARFNGGTITSDITMSGASDIWSKGADVASAAALPLITDGNYFDVTGTTTITSMASMGVGTWICLQFDGALTLTHNATDLILPGGANITTAAGDHAIFIEYASGDWRCVSYIRSNALNNPLVSATAVASTSGTSIDFTGIPSWVKRITVMFSGVSTNGTSIPILQLGTSGAPETSGYSGSIYQPSTSANVSSAGFNLVRAMAAATVLHGQYTLSLLNPATNTWVCSGVLGMSNTADNTHIGASKSLAGTLNMIRLTTGNGTDAYDAGLVNIFYE
jgi:hypothetical protein